MLVWIVELVNKDLDRSQVVGVFSSIETVIDYIKDEKNCWPKEENMELRAEPFIVDEPHSKDPRLTVWDGVYQGIRTSVQNTRHFNTDGSEITIKPWWLQDCTVPSEAVGS